MNLKKIKIELNYFYFKLKYLPFKLYKIQLI